MTNAEYQTQRLINGGASLLRALTETVEAYMEEEGTTRDCALRDVLTDLRHFCDIHGLDFGEIDKRAYQGYVEELPWREDPNDAEYVKPEVQP